MLSSRQNKQTKKWQSYQKQSTNSMQCPSKSHKNSLQTWKNDTQLHIEKQKIQENTVAQTLRETINKWDLPKLKSFCKAKDIINKTKWQPIAWEKIFTNHTSARVLISKIYKELKKLVIKRRNNPKKKMEYRPKQRILNKI